MKPLVSHGHRWAAVCMACPWWLVACSPTPGAGWFPLHVGHEQVYAVRYDTTEPRPDEVWTQTVLRQENWQSVSVSVRRHSAGVEFYLHETPEGVQRVAVRTDADEEPLADTPPRWVLKAPYQVGTEWTTSSVPYLIQRRNEHPRELRHTHSVQLQWRIAALDESVQTAAGLFSPCMRVEGSGQINLYTDPVNGFNNVTIEAREWYCLGQGLVRWERHEPIAEGFFVGGSVSAELIR